jgi:hypothetical protein
MRALYDNPRDRDAGDLDLMVDNVDDAWELVRYFKRRGFDWCEYEWPWLKRDVRSRNLYGQFQVWQEIRGQYLRFDIHFGGYSVRHCRLSEWTSSAVGYRPAAPTANLPCLLGNAAGDFLIRLKDVNDITLLLRRGMLDRQFVKSVVVGLGFERFWNALLSRTSELSALTDDELGALSELYVRGMRPQHVPFGTPSHTARTIATVLDAARVGREDRGLIGGLTNGLGALRYYAKKLTVQIHSCKHDRPSKVVSTMSNSTCVRLIPQRMLNSDDNAAPAPFRRNLTGSGLLDEVIVDGHIFIEADGDRFVPTIFYRLCSVEANGDASRRATSE